MKASHYVALGTLLVSLSTFFATLDSWAAFNKPATFGAFVGIIGSFIIAFFSNKPRVDENTRVTDFARKPPKIAVLFIAAGLLPVMVGCGVKAYHVAQVSATGAHGGLKFAESVLDSQICGKPTALPDKCVPVAKRVELATPIADAYHDDATVQKVILDWDPTKGAAPDYVTLLGNITRTIQTIVNSLPTDAAKAKVVAAVNGPAKK